MIWRGETRRSRSCDCPGNDLGRIDGDEQLGQLAIDVGFVRREYGFKARCDLPAFAWAGFAKAGIHELMGANRGQLLFGGEAFPIQLG